MPDWGTSGPPGDIKLLYQPDFRDLSISHGYWQGIGDPLGHGGGNQISNPGNYDFFKSDGYWDSPSGRFFLEWYSGMLLMPGERLCVSAESIFSGTGVSTSAKLAVVHMHYDTKSHASKLTAGFYNTSIGEGYLPIARMFARYGMILSCSCFELRDVVEKEMHPGSSPEGLLRQILLTARATDLPIYAENFAGGLNTETLEQVLKMYKFYSDGLDNLVFSFNFVRLNDSFLETSNLVGLNNFVKQISGSGSVQAQPTDWRDSHTSN